MTEGVIEYPLRTPAIYWIVVGAMVAIALVGAGLAIYTHLHGLSGVLEVICLALIATPALYLRGTREYRASGAIKLAPGVVVVPDWRGEPIAFAADRLRLHVTRVTVRLTFLGVGVGDVSRGKVIALEAAGTRRRISTLTLVEPDHGDALIEDLERVLRGEAPRGPNAPTHGRPAAPPDRYQEELERELAALD